MNKLDKIRLFKYYQECGFFCKLFGIDEFVLDKSDSPYSKSLLRLIGNNIIDNKFILITNNTTNTYNTDDDFRKLLCRVNRPNSVKLDIWNTVIKRRKNGRKKLQVYK